MQELITRLKVDIAREIKYGYPLDKRSWGDEDGLLITVNEASQIVALYEREQKQSKKESNCNLPQVSKCYGIERRNLLIDFCEVYATGNFGGEDSSEKIVDWYLKAKDN